MNCCRGSVTGQLNHHYRAATSGSFLITLKKDAIDTILYRAWSLKDPILNTKIFIYASFGLHMKFKTL